MPISQDLVLVPLLAAVGAFALVGLIWSLTEGYFEERKQQRP
jgi:hypothetical protein